ncbi:hypothetical protein TCAL_02506 [Tigriopus californicus]|uniref:UBX domain-containing protein n=1 Tax=Tigriopus californicus TaxID=6832 RepID=A0A553NSK0_TIGCA|nr:tether containing UBX domain for GLUT4-like [Tigriopus californicus]TRY68416.1 hypothetical protein TCAL_02506 [Tigriopus californicus]|eukprot:TCALIF_02506-PA protein Name:"Similar to ASPSCR1 Tether containing UBX domain for GLUT4 (Homo sapiens)" AED:0.00 eAED:0.00 QI:0/-1/0/1/-1/1/1/0/539
MSKFVLNVLCPTGHTVTVPSTPNDTLTDVVRAACQKRGGSLQAHHFHVLHHQKRMSLTQLVRHSGLPNKAWLELKEKTPQELAEDEKRRATPIQVALQDETGQRKKLALDGQLSLWAVLAAFEVPVPAAEDPIMPVVVFGRSEMCGRDVLAAKTLHTLAGGEGRVLLRFLTKAQHSQGQLKGTFDIQVRHGQAQRSSSPPIRPMRATLEDTGTEHLIPKPVDQPVEPVEPMEVEGSKIIKDEVESPARPEPAVKVEAPVKSEPDPGSSSSSAQDVVVGTEVKVEPVINYIHEDHSAVVYRLDDGSVSARCQVDDSFFDLTVEEVRRLYQERIKEVKRLEEGEQLVTKGYKEAQKEAQKLQTLQQFHKSVIRIQFPDKLVLQGVFLSGQTIADVKAFIQQFLIHSDDAFDLFVTPPKTILSPDMNLLDAGCVPSALLYFTSPAQRDRYLKSELDQSLSNQAGARQAVRNADRKRPTRLVRPPSQDVAEICQSALNDQPSTCGSRSITAEPTSDSTDVSPPKIQTTSADKLPKWLTKGKQL